MIYEKWLDRKTLTDEEWRKARKSGLGGSDAAAVAGLNPYSSPLSVYYDKIGELPEKETTESMRQGTDLEEYVAKRFTEQTGKRIQRCNYVLRYKDEPYMLADVDRMIVGENALLECKTTQNRDGYNFADNDYPMYWFCQCLHYMVVTGADKVYLAVLEFGRGFYVIEINRAEHLEDLGALIQIERAFWNDNVLGGVPPIADGSEATTKALSVVYPQDDADTPTVDLMPYTASLEKLGNINKQIAELEAEKDAIINELKAALGDASIGEYDRYKVTWKYSERTTIDSKRLKAEHPDLYELYSKTSGSRTFKFTEKS